MKRPKTTTLDSLAAEERKHYRNAQKRLGAPYLVARETTILLTTFIKFASKNRYVFAGFIALIQNHQTLSLLSSVRFHHVQAMMNLRQALESASNAAFALANPLESYSDETTGFMLDSRAVSSRSIKWIESEFQEHSDQIKNIKNEINRNSAHSNIIQSARLVDTDFDNDIINTSFFDREDQYDNIADLLIISKSAIIIMDLIWAVNQKHGGISFSDDFTKRFSQVRADHADLVENLKQTKRFQDATSGINERKLTKRTTPSAVTPNSAI
ncbi:hypothetical protein [Phenylobacterium sp.]|uniref:hypothetical protein n=1 Tax=Phenylobacterium sp. TaxID=1871053 RepID=UPI0025F4EDDE|nr:hypothetical protein [Phenylobacterium sp.]MCA6289683.1 hypothetical protein [Phenylobacterium sp.]MCA6342547.1 hypothetical protein [Phenylobacterium sp.]